MHPVSLAKIPAGKHQTCKTDSTSDQGYVAERWHQFLIYVGLTLGSFVINAFGNSILPLIYRGACVYLGLEAHVSGQRILT